MLYLDFFFISLFIIFGKSKSVRLVALPYPNVRTQSISRHCQLFLVGYFGTSSIPRPSCYSPSLLPFRIHWESHDWYLKKKKRETRIGQSRKISKWIAQSKGNWSVSIILCCMCSCAHSKVHIFTVDHGQECFKSFTSFIRFCDSLNHTSCLFHLSTRPTWGKV